MISTGLFELVFLVVNHRSIRRWLWPMIGGIADLVIGGYLLENPLIGMLLLPVLVGLWFLFRGITAVGDALHIRSHGYKGWKRLLFKAFTILLMAGLILAFPAIGLENLILWTSLAFIAAGVFRCYLTLKIRQWKGDLDT